MSSTADYRAGAMGEPGVYYDSPAGTGWIAFAACMLGLAGTWNMIDGFLAVGSSHVYGANTVFTFSDLKTWGWILIITGALQIAAALGVATGSELARWFGIATASLNAIVQLGFIPSAPWWSIAMFSLDVLVIFGLAVYGGKKLRQSS